MSSAGLAIVSGRMGRQRGMSLVELMVGITIGLFIVAGASLLASNQMSDNRRLLMETQVQQDLRAAADLIVRDIRRAGYWQVAASGVWQPNAAPLENPYAAMTPASAASAVNEIQYNYSVGAENNAVDAAEQFGVRLSDGVIEMRLGGAGWQALTDANTVRITRLDITLDVRTIDLPCMIPCAVGAANCPRRQDVRDVAIVIEGTAVHDAKVKRGVTSGTRLRNDAVYGTCPSS